MRRRISLALVLLMGLTAAMAEADFTFGMPEELGPSMTSPKW
ncbi:MAG: hypothetical protein ACYSWW_14045 [Planctomycetota bacterium]|jgi:hypothetical protein